MSLPSWQTCHLSQTSLSVGRVVMLVLTQHLPLSLQAPFSHVELHSACWAGASTQPPAEPPLLVPALHLPDMSAIH